MFGGLRQLAFRICRNNDFLRYHVRLNLRVVINDRDMIIPLIDGEYPQYEDYEPWMLQVLGKVLPARPGAFIDVGTNKGQTLLKVASVDPERRYIGFEPNISCCYFVDTIIRQNRLRNHSVFQLALSDAPGHVSLMLSRRGTESSTIAPGVRSEAAYHGKTTVLRNAGDTVLEGFSLDGIAIVKIDVEGGELEVLRGLTATIRSKEPWLIFEILPPYLVYMDESRRSGQKQEKVLQTNIERAKQIFGFLKEMNYVFFHIDGGALRRFVGDLFFESGARLDLSNFLAVHRKDEAEVLSVLELRSD